MSGLLKSGLKMLEEEKTPQPPPNKSPLYKRMTIVMHCIIFLYAAAFWIQTGVLPVSCSVSLSYLFTVLFSMAVVPVQETGY